MTKRIVVWAARLVLVGTFIWALPGAGAREWKEFGRTFAATRVAPAAPAIAQVQPMYNIEGTWQYLPSGTTACFRDGSVVTCTLVNGSFSHLLVGRYISPTQIALNVTRRNRANQCTTYMSLTITMQSNTAYVSNWVALDGACDLRPGQSGADPAWTRVN